MSPFRKYLAMAAKNEQIFPFYFNHSWVPHHEASTDVGLENSIKRTLGKGTKVKREYFWSKIFGFTLIFINQIFWFYLGNPQCLVLLSRQEVCKVFVSVTLCKVSRTLSPAESFQWSQLGRRGGTQCLNCPLNLTNFTILQCRNLAFLNEGIRSSKWYLILFYLNFYNWIYIY